MRSVYWIAVPVSYEFVNNGIIKSTLYVCLIVLSSCHGRTDWLTEECVPEWRLNENIAMLMGGTGCYTGTDCCSFVDF